MVSAWDVAWQNKTIPRSSDLRGVLILGLLAAWFYFVWQCLSLPPFAAVMAGLPPLLGSALAKGQYMPDFGMVIAGFAAFHFRRELRQEWDTRIALQIYLAAVLPLLAYLGFGVALLEAVRFAAPARPVAWPWQEPLIAVQFRVLGVAIVFAVLWPLLLYFLWTSILDIGLSGVIIALIYYGMDFTLGWHDHLFMRPVSALFAFLLGVSLCTTVFRAIVYLAPVRGAMIVLGWVSMAAASILVSPVMFFLGFLLVVSGSAIGERSFFLPGERALLIWSRTALGLFVVQPAVFAAWLVWRQPAPAGGWAAFLVLAVAAQLLAALVALVVEMPARRLIPAVPA